MNKSLYTNIAFISYKREDEAWAKWLQKKLQYYKLPVDVCKKHPNMEFSECPRHVFKDTTDLSGGVLAKAIKAGLDSSKFLIVICSPRAAKSEWVCKEVQDFIDAGREEYIIPFIIEGEPYARDTEQECFPASLKALAGERELLGININENGREAAAVKVAARMFELNFDTLWQRFQRERRNKHIKIGIALLFLILSLIGISIYIQYKNTQLAVSNKLMIQNRSRYVLNEAMDLIHNGDIYMAQRLCRDLIIHGEDDALIKPEIEKVLYAAEDSLNCPYKQIAIFKEHSKSVQKVCFSPNADFVASRDNDSKVLIRKTNSGEIVCTIDSITSLDGHNIDFNPNGKEILISGNELASFSLKTGRKTKVIDKWGEYAVYNKNGDKVFYVKDRCAYLYHLRDKRKECVFLEKEDCRCIMGKFSPKDNSIVMVVKEGGIGNSGYYLWFLNEQGKLRKRILAHEREVRDMAFSPTGDNVVTASTDNTAKVWHVQTGKLLSVFNDIKDYVTSVKFDPTGKFVISTGFKNVYLWNHKDGTSIKELKGHNRLTTYADISSDGRYLVSSSADNTVRLWTLKTHSKENKYRKIIPGCGHIVEWIPNKDSTIIIYGDGYKYDIYNLKMNKVRRTKYKGLGTRPIFTDNETCFIRVCTDNYIRKWNVESGCLVDSINIKDSKIASDFIWWYRSAVIDDTHAYITGNTHTYAYDMTKNTIIPFLDKRILYYDSKNSKAAIVDKNYNVGIISLEGDSLFSLQQKTSSLSELDFSLNGNFIATSERYSIRVWGANNGEKIFENSDSKSLVYYCKFSNDSKHLISGGGMMESEMRIWDTSSWTCIIQKFFPKPAGTFFWINNDKSILINTEDAIYRLDLPCYEKIVNRINTIFQNMELSNNERSLYYINR